MTPLWIAAGCVAFLAEITAVVARALRDADPLDRPGAFRQAMADPNRDNDRDDLGGHR